MRTMFILVAVVLTSAAIASAPDTTEAPKATKSGHEIFLSAEQDKLFATGRLNETVIPPLYTSVEQVIFTEQVKQNVRKN